MKGTFFSMDFIEDVDGNVRLMEINTDTAIVEGGITNLDFTDFIDMLDANSITEVHTISKAFQSGFVNALSQSLSEDAPFITVFENHMEEDSTIYPSSVVDTTDRFIMRLAYDEAAIFDSEYAKNKLAPLDLFYTNDDTGSIVEYYVSSSANGVTDILPMDFNSAEMPDIAVKNLNTNVNNSIKFFKIGHSSSETDVRYDKVKEAFSENNLIIKFYENPSDTKVKSIRSVNVIYGPNLDVITFGSFISEALFEKPVSLEFDDEVIITNSNVKHYYELTTNYPRFTNVNNWGGIFEEEEVVKADGGNILIGSASVGTELKSYFIEGAPNTDVVSEFMQWSSPGSSMPSGSYETSSVVVNNIEQELSNNTIFHLVMEDGSDFRASGGAHLLVYDNEKDVLRYESVSKIDESLHKLVNLDGGLVNISASYGEILDGDYKTIIVDMETTDTFFLYNGGLSVKIVTHNCFPAGTKITLADGSEKNIEDLTTDDKLLTYNEKTGILSEGTIGNIVKKKEFLLIQLESEDGSIVKSTALHKFYVKGKGWVAAQDIVKGDVLIKKDKSETIVVDRNDLSGEVDVYHIIDVKDNHTYFAEGLLVHNFKYSGGSCFVAGTKVTMGDGSEKNIEDVVVGDEVLSFNESTLQNEVKKVIGLKTPIHNDLVKYEFANQTSITSTFDHPFYVGNLELASFTPFLTNKRYELDRDVRQIKVGDMVYLSNGVSKTAIKDIIELDEKDTQTYIITVEDNHNFYANGILVHNK
jgi:intein/homing endonuclease